MIPVYLRRPGSVAPDSNIYYVVAQNGVYLHIKNDWMEATVPVKGIPSLCEETTCAELFLSDLDSLVFAKIHAFFLKVYRRYASEAAVLLHYSTTQGWEITVPKQSVSAAGVRFEMSERLPGYRCVGTAHSHGRLLAAHSPTDDADEIDFDGVHVIIGHMHRAPVFSMEASLVVRGNRFPIESKMGGVSVVEGDGPLEGTSFLKLEPQNCRCFYTLDTSILGDWSVPDEWMTQVAKMPMVPLRPSLVLRGGETS